MMKRLMNLTLAMTFGLTVLGSAAATARDWGHGRYGDYRPRDSYSQSWRHGRHHSGDDGAATALGIGLGLFALAAIVSSAQRDDRYDSRYDYGPPPPPPPPAYGRGYYGYDGY